MRLSEHRYSTITAIKSPLLVLDEIVQARMGEGVRIIYPDGRQMDGEILKINKTTVLVQVFGESQGLDVNQSSVVFSDSVKRAPLSLDLLDRVFSGSFEPMDGIDMFVPDTWAPVTGFPLNPASRARPEEFIETGFAAIDGLNTLVKGQKLPIFSCAGLPSKELAARILRQARMLRGETSGSGAEFVVIFVALGLTHHEYAYYMDTLEGMGTGFVAFINLADDPVVERILSPRFGLTVAEYLAFEKKMDVLVVITDMTNYCDALREVSTAREELPGRRGYPGYMYSDLASLFERAGRIRGCKGSVTMLPVVTMPEDDITHPIPDLTGYITEGQIVLSRELHRKGIFPPIDVLPSLSRLMQHGIGEGRTRKDHRAVANFLYRHYARGRDLRNLETIVGREGMSDQDQVMLDFAEALESDFIHQETGGQTVHETLDKGMDLLKRFQLEVP